jgi:Tol biopolymer transport system component
MQMRTTAARATGVGVVVAVVTAGFLIWGGESRSGIEPKAGRTIEPPRPGPAAAGLTFIRARPGGKPGIDDRELVAITPDGAHELDLTRTDAQAEWDGVWSPDSSRVAITSATPDGGGDGSGRGLGGLSVMNADGSGRRLLVGCPEPNCISHPGWSRDGDWLAFVRRDRVDYANGSISPYETVWVVKADGTGLRELCPFGHPGCPQRQGPPAWTPDGDSVVFADFSATWGLFTPLGGLHAANRDGTGAARFGAGGCTEDCPFDSNPSWSPDGERVAWARQRTSGTGLRHQVVVAGPDGTGERIIFDCPQPTCYGPDVATWSPDGSRMALVNTVEGGGNEIRVMDADGGHPRAIPPCTEDGRCLGVGELVWSPDGTELGFLSADPRSSLWLMDAGGEALRSIAEGIDCCLAWLVSVPDLGAAPAPSPVFSLANLPPAPFLPGLLLTFSPPVTSIETDGSGLRVLIGGAKPNGGPVWYPDGRMVAYAGHRTGSVNAQVLISNVDGSDRRVLTDDRYGAVPFSWSPDGRRLLFGCEERAMSGICVINVDGSNRGTLIRQGNGAWDASYSPDGRTIAYTADAGPRGEAIWLAGEDGSNPRLLTDLPGGQSEGAWSPDGRRLAFVWWTASGQDIYTIGADGSDLRRVTDVPGEVGSPVWSPDGAWIAFRQVTFEEGGQHANAILLIRPGGSGLSRVYVAGHQISGLAWLPGSPPGSP